MLSHIRELEQLLGNNGIQVSPWQATGHNTPDAVLDSLANPTQGHSELSKDQWQQVGSLWVKNYQQKPPPTSGYTRYPLLETRPTETYLGVSSDNAPLSSMSGASKDVMSIVVPSTDSVVP